MKIYAKCPDDMDVEQTPYLTPGKVYEVTSEAPPMGFRTKSDEGRDIFCLWDYCAHLLGLNWERVEEK